MVGGVLQESTLDQVFTSNANLVEDIRIVSPIGHSDHLTIMVDLRLFDEVIFMLKEKKNYVKCDWDRVRQLSNNTSWTFTVNKNVDLIWDELYSKIMNIVDLSVPVRVQKCTSDGVPIKKAPWESSILRRSRKSKDKAWNVFDSSPTSINFRKALDAQYIFEQSLECF